MPDPKKCKKEVDTEESDEEMIVGKKEQTYIEEIKSFLGECNLNLVPYPFTLGDGNCWYRSISDQVKLMKIANKP